MANLSLYAVEAVVILDNDGQRIYAKYFNPPHQAVEEDSLSSNVKLQKELEATLFKRTHKQNADILILDEHLVLYKECADVCIYLLGPLDENEIVLQDTLGAMKLALEMVLNTDLDKRSLQDNYEIVCLVVDETVDDGIILETEARTIASRVTKSPTQETVVIDLSEKGLLSAWGFAKSKLAERLQQGL
ncbi:AGL016Cp [Eremothecium gossypii ATCC 10895]|uniref:Coatomer subunit zeta n=1 Tax=Eremothecium gossypii (strain ATCC 10895 / CBS 109.51 / FGSC 9923 / NRRL Y-1056) TaxID=284811 RepID=Q750G9_EREGS|nr:AGL016Cp [Eremothecium gossypii ATCC 10895]AAS54474.1 AGL016Cp [Eremothecium gossypii ATCC 10895]AEY98806.1 FAGL016Cp [Eremothecium gossypii FDAG1]